MLKQLIVTFNHNLHHRSVTKKKKKKKRNKRILRRLYTKLIMLSIDFEQNFGVFQSIGYVDLLITAAQIQEFCQLFWLKYRKKHSAKNAIISYVQEIKLAYLSSCEHGKNTRKHCSITKLIWVDWRRLCVKSNTMKKGLPEWNKCVFQAITIYRLFVKKTGKEN